LQRHKFIRKRGPVGKQQLPSDKGLPGGRQKKKAGTGGYKGKVKAAGPATH